MLVKCLKYMKPISISKSTSNLFQLDRQFLCFNVTTKRILHVSGSSGKNWQMSIESKINFAIEYAVHNGLLEYGDPYIALYKGSDYSSFCDTVRILKVVITKRVFVE